MTDPRKKKPGTAAKTKKPKPGEGPFGALKALKKKLEEEEKRAAEAPKGPGRPLPAAGRPPAARPPKAVAVDPDEEAFSFHRMMSGVTPLDTSRGTRLPLSQTPVERSPAATLAAKRASVKTAAEEEAAAVHEHLRTLVEARVRFEVADDGRRVEGRRVDLPPEALRRLRRGVLPIDARMDLHGMKGGEARAALEGFLRAKRALGERCVLVVHGKGDHSPGGMGILRGEISAWLSQGAASEHVAAFATATDGDGGEGAVYVLLRK